MIRSRCYLNPIYERELTKLDVHQRFPPCVLRACRGKYCGQQDNPLEMMRFCATIHLIWRRMMARHRQAHAMTATSTASSRKLVCSAFLARSLSLALALARALAFSLSLSLSLSFSATRKAFSTRDEASKYLTPRARE